MPNLRKAAAFSVLILAMIASASAEKMVSAKFGISWPQALLSTAVPSEDVELSYGMIIDRKIAFGVSGDFLWNVQAKVEKVPSTTNISLYKTLSEQKTFMFPVMAFFQLDPVPDLVVHPVAHFQIGYNSMIYSYMQTESSVATSFSPYFYGLIMKLGVDGLYSIGKSSSLFLGMEYRWADMQNASNNDGLFNKRDMSGIGISLGFRVSI
jgi:hypothetical protein